MTKQPKFKIEFLDYGPDAKGRRRFILEWWRDAWDADYCAEHGIQTRVVKGKTLMARGQVFFARPEEHGFTADGKPLRYAGEC